MSDCDRMKILFIINNMKIGGTRSSLINLLHLLPYDKVEAHLLILSPHGPYMSEIDKRVKVLPTTRTCEWIFSNKKDLSGLNKFGKYIFAAIHKILGDKMIYKIAAKGYSYLEAEKYDAVIGCQEGDTVNMAALLPGKTHMCWIHSDYAYSEKNTGYRSSFDVMDRICFVADAAMKSFDLRFSGYNGKLQVIKNTIDTASILEKSKEQVKDAPFENERIRLVSVGRVAAPKHYIRAIKAAKALSKIGISFKWIIIGDGDEKSMLEKKTQEEGLEDCIKFIGARKNPYPYIAMADALIVTSIYESQPMVILESLILGVPVLSTDFSSAKEILNGKDYAVICDNTDEAVADAIVNIVKSEMLTPMKQATKDFFYDNESIVQQILEGIV